MRQPISCLPQLAPVHSVVLCRSSHTERSEADKQSNCAYLLEAILIMTASLTAAGAATARPRPEATREVPTTFSPILFRAIPARKISDANPYMRDRAPGRDLRETDLSPQLQTHRRPFERRAVIRSRSLVCGCKRAGRVNVLLICPAGRLASADALLDVLYSCCPSLQHMMLERRKSSTHDALYQRLADREVGYGSR